MSESKEIFRFVALSLTQAPQIHLHLHICDQIRFDLWFSAAFSPLFSFRFLEDG